MPVMQHWEVGGSTDAVWWLAVWLLPGVKLGEDKWVRSVPCAAPDGKPECGAQVLRSRSEPGAVSSAGLFPYDRLSQRVLVPNDWSPTGFRTWSLSQVELEELWDIPILLRDLIKGDAR